MQLSHVTRDVFDLFRLNGIELAAWWYSYPTTTGNELSVASKLVTKYGFNHLIIDAEIEWETQVIDKKIVSHDWRVTAKDFAARLRREVGPDAYLADSPWPIRSAHRIFPFDEFGGQMNARMPQFYHMLASKPFEAYATKADAQWSQTPSELICPIGSPVDAFGKIHCPIADVSSFLDRYADRPARSLWSWQHLNADEWALLEERETLRIESRQTQPTLPEIDPSDPTICGE